jgi:hypothetical protein
MDFDGLLIERGKLLDCLGIDRGFLLREGRHSKADGQPDSAATKPNSTRTTSRDPPPRLLPTGQELTNKRMAAGHEWSHNPQATVFMP